MCGSLDAELNPRPSSFLGIVCVGQLVRVNGTGKLVRENTGTKLHRRDDLKEINGLYTVK